MLEVNLLLWLTFNEYLQCARHSSSYINYSLINQNQTMTGSHFTAHFSDVKTGDPENVRIFSLANVEARLKHEIRPHLLKHEHKKDFYIKDFTVLDFCVGQRIPKHISSLKIHQLSTAVL